MTTRVLLFLCAITVITSFLHNFRTIHNRKCSNGRRYILTNVGSETGSTPIFGGVNDLDNNRPRNFITKIIDEDLRNGRNEGKVLTRFPPEPNGYLHLGHAKSVHLNFGISQLYGGLTNMRFDDTNPDKEDEKYAHAILDDVRWILNSDDYDFKNKKEKNEPWNGNVRYTSDYFDTLYQGAVYLIKEGKAYVDDLTYDEMHDYRGTLISPGMNSPYRTRSVEENLNLFEAMRNGSLPSGKCCLRAKIDMSSPNINLRDPTLYRIKHTEHPNTGTNWCIYPMYDYAHAVSDALEGITHSLCTLEFADHRPLYDWFILSLLPSNILSQSSPGPDHGSMNKLLEITICNKPVQIEFSRLNVQYTVLSKRKLIQLVDGKYVNGWDDPRMPTISGMRRRGIPSQALALFCNRVGISKSDQIIDIGVLEDCTREVLDKCAPRAFAIMDPLKITISNWEEEKEEEIFSAPNHPKDMAMGNRNVPFGKSIYIERSDFFDIGINGELKPPKGFKKLLLGSHVRLRLAYVIKCDKIIRDPITNLVLELICSYDIESRAGVTPPGQKRVGGIIHWVSAKSGLNAEIRLFDRLFVAPIPGKNHDGDFLKDLNNDSLSIIQNAIVESSLSTCTTATTYQFERTGYFVVESTSPLAFNRIVTLRDTWGP